VETDASSPPLTWSPLPGEKRLFFLDVFRSLFPCRGRILFPTTRTAPLFFLPLSGLVSELLSHVADYTPLDVARHVASSPGYLPPSRPGKGSAHFLFF